MCFVCLQVYLNVFYFARWQPGRVVAEILTHCCRPNSLDGVTDFVKSRPLWSSALNKVKGPHCVKGILIGCLHCVYSLDNCQPSPSSRVTQPGYRGQCLEKGSLGRLAASGLEKPPGEREGAKPRGRNCQGNKRP